MGSKEEYQRLGKAVIPYLEICENQSSWERRTDTCRNVAQFLNNWINLAKSLWNVILTEEESGVISSGDKNKLKKWIAELEAIFKELRDEMLQDVNRKMNPHGFQKFFNKSNFISQYMGYIGTRLGVKG